VKFCGVAFALVVAASPAAAQSVIAFEPSWPAQYGRAAIVPPYEVVAIVRSFNLRPVRPPVWSGGRYVVRAVNWQGAPVRVIVDRYGRILRVGPAFASRWSRHGRFGPIAPYYLERNPPLPPRGVISGRPLRGDPRVDGPDDSARLSNAPLRRPAISRDDEEAAAFPLPRPRPTAALRMNSPRETPDQNLATGSIAKPAAAETPAVAATKGTFPPVTPLD
jgi:hypothetical protein